jgi:methylated-DNA-[protein]-cysteine S-methyltransferase
MRAKKPGLGFDMNSIYFYETCVGRIGIADNGEAVTRVMFAGKAGGGPCGYDMCPDGYTVAQTALIKEAAKQLNEYLDGKRTAFDIPLALEGTPFQMAVWKALQDIPYGETRSYRDIAESIGRPKACRAVGMANNKNPVAVFVPCHRVIGSDGKLVGYAGGMDVKEKLLALERQTMRRCGQSLPASKTEVLNEGKQ